MRKGRAPLQLQGERAPRRRARKGEPALAEAPAPAVVAGAAGGGPELARLPSRDLRQGLARSLGRQHGNAYLQRLLAPAAPAIQRAAAGPAEGMTVQRQPGGGQPLLRLGSASPAVVTLQQQLNAAGAALAADGQFGPATQRAVVAFQKAAGLAPDGIVGPKTWGRLQAGGITIAPPAAGGRGGGDAALLGGAATLTAKLGVVRRLMQQLSARRAPGSLVSAAGLLPPPAGHEGWADDALDWAKEQVDEAGAWVEEKVDTVVDAATGAATSVAETAGEVKDWVGDKVDAAVDTAKEVAAGAGAAAGWVSETAKAAAAELQATAGGVADTVRQELAALDAGLREQLGPALAILDEVVGDLGRPFGPDLNLADLGRKLDGLIGELQQHTGTALAKIDPTQSSTTVTKSSGTSEVSGQSLVEVANALGGHAGSVARAVNGLDLQYFDTDPTKTIVKATIQISLTKTMPKWKEYDEQCQPVKNEWDRFYGALDRHENNHLAKFLSVYTSSMHVPLLGKSEAAANTKFEADDNHALQINTDYDAATANGINEAPSTKINPIACGLEKVK